MIVRKLAAKALKLPTCIKSGIGHMKIGNPTSLSKWSSSMIGQLHNLNSSHTIMYILCFCLIGDSPTHRNFSKPNKTC